MSITGKLNRQTSEPIGQRDSPVALNRYLTDGTRLFYTVGMAGGRHEFVCLEDCGSLDLLLVTVDEALRLRPVSTPLDGE